MKKWRIGSTAMGLFLIFLGVDLVVARVDPSLGAALLRNSWPVLLVVLGLEVLLSNYFLNKADVKYTYDFLSLVFVGAIALFSMGVYSLQTIGLWDRLTEAVNGSARAVEHQVEVVPKGQGVKVILDADFRNGPVRIWNSTDGRIHVIVHGYTYQDSRGEQGQDLAAVVTAGQIGRTVLVTLRRLREEPPWRTRVDRVDLLIPPALGLEIEHPDNLDVHADEFDGVVTGVDEGP